jgi:hypothetical protein
MSQSTTIAWVIAVVVIMGGGYYWYTHQGSAPSDTPLAETTDQGQKSGTSPSDTSDAAIIQDAAVVDGDLVGLDADNASMNQSLNDEPVSQSY